MSFRWKSHLRVLELQLICLCSAAANRRPAVVGACGHFCMTLVGETILTVLIAWFIQHIKVWYCRQLTGLDRIRAREVLSFLFQQLDFYMFVCSGEHIKKNGILFVRLQQSRIIINKWDRFPSIFKVVINYVGFSSDCFWTFIYLYTSLYGYNFGLQWE